jgi:hypothetical protein
VNASAAVGIYKTNAGVKTERFLRRHFIRMSLRALNQNAAVISCRFGASAGFHGACYGL